MTFTSSLRFLYKICPSDPWCGLVYRMKNLWCVRLQMARSKWIFLCSSSFLHLLYHTKMMTNLNLLKLEIRCLMVFVCNWKALLIFLFPICTKEIQKRLREAHLYFFLIHILRFWQVCFPTDTVTFCVVNKVARNSSSQCSKSAVDCNPKLQKFRSNLVILYLLRQV